MNVVVVATRAIGGSPATRESVQRFVSRGDVVRLVSLAGSDAVDGLDGVAALGPAVSGASLGTPGRILVRIWPGSLARQLRRAVRRSAQARTWLDDADLVVGVEPATAQLLWRHARAHSDVPHVVGLDSALIRSGA